MKQQDGGGQCVEIRSLTNIQAPVVVFHSFTERCKCGDHLSEKEMFSHKILAKKGFHERFFLPWHFRRTRVVGSVVGWVPPSPAAIDEMVGANLEEVMESEESLTSDPGKPAVVGAEGCADNDMNVSWPEVESDLTGNTLAPVGYIRSEEEGVTPMTEKQIRVIFEGVL